MGEWIIHYSLHRVTGLGCMLWFASYNDRNHLKRYGNGLHTKCIDKSGYFTKSFYTIDEEYEVYHRGCSTSTSSIRKVSFKISRRQKIDFNIYKNREVR
ncbi:hypothetical protein ACH3XW_28705 [Acanthocheilonema viteae]